MKKIWYRIKAKSIHWLELLLRCIFNKLPGKKLCLYPFYYMSLENKYDFIPCCSGWLRQEYLDLNKRKGAADWNSAQALTLRKKMLDGDFSFCKRDVCNPKIYSLPLLKVYFFLNNVFKTNFLHSFFSTQELAAIIAGNPERKNAPTQLQVNCDCRCNLKCTSCRNSYLKQDDRFLALGEEILHRYRNVLKQVLLAGNGEIMFSPWYQNVLQWLGDKKSFPALEGVLLLTNGTLLTEKKIMRLGRLKNMIQLLMVSVDAGDAETYRKVRGGNWKQLMKNLTWVGEHKQKLHIKKFLLGFVIRKDNYKSINKFLKLAERVNADGVVFQAFLKWPHIPESYYQQQTVFCRDNVEYPQFSRIWKNVRGNKLIKNSFDLIK